MVHISTTKQDIAVELNKIVQNFESLENSLAVVLKRYFYSFLYFTK